MTIIDEHDLQAWLAAHPDWRYERPEIAATYRFADFAAAIAFVVQAALLAEKHDHHPDIDVRYNTVRVAMATHDAGNKITERDLKLAEKLDSGFHRHDGAGGG